MPLRRRHAHDRRPDIVKLGDSFQGFAALLWSLSEELGRPSAQLVGQLGTVEHVQDLKRDGVIQYSAPNFAPIP